MRSLLVLTVLSSACLSSAAAPATPVAPDEAAIAKAVGEVKDAVVQAYIDLDAAALDELYTDDFTVTDAAGATRTKADELAYVRSSPEARVRAGSYKIIKVRVFGDIAVATGQATLTGEGKDGPFEHTYYSFNVFRREQGRWRYAAAFTP